MYYYIFYLVLLKTVKVFSINLKRRTHEGDLVCVYHFILVVQIVLAVIKLHDRIFYVLDYMDRL